VVTISQKSINCIYNNISSTATTAWGCEWTDETESPLLKSDGTKATTISEVDPVVTRKNAWLYDDGQKRIDTKRYYQSPSEYPAITIESTTKRYNYNIDNSNGKLNTGKEWDLCNNGENWWESGEKIITKTPEWGKYMYFEVDNDTPDLNDTHRYLRYACMTRNRDNNGNGTLDPEEFRWYMAAPKQVIGLFLAKSVLSQDTQIYNRTNEEIAQTDRLFWRQHIITSSCEWEASSNPRIIWGEEGVATSNLSSSLWVDWSRDSSYCYPTLSPERWTVRCVRNLGNVSDDAKDLSREPSELFSVKPTSTKIINNTEGEAVSYTVNVIDCSNLNNGSFRYYTSQELPRHHEKAVDNRPYIYFEVIERADGTALATVNAIKDASGKTTTKYAYEVANDTIDGSLSNPYCPTGYRLPNQAETVIINQLLDAKYTITRTDWSLGKNAKRWGYAAQQKNPEDKVGFVSFREITLGSEDSIPIYRCVRDLKPEEVQ